jgi:hypothetical protein
MIEIKSRWKSVTDSERWAARGASFVTKAKATKAVWFPPKPVETGKKAASTARKTTKKTTDAGKETTKKTAGVAKKTANGTRKVTTPVGRKKT